MFRRISSAAAVVDAVFPRAATVNPATQDGSAYNFVLTSVDGSPLPLARFQGKALLIVNTASRCGFNFQYAALQETWRQYQDQGLVVIGIPSNDFGGQEPKSEKEIQSFYRETYGVTFPLAAKTHVRGDDAHDIYKWAAEVLGDKGRPRWNFHKYLTNADGQLVAWFSSTVTPRSQRLRDAIEGVLPRGDDAE